MLQFIWFCWPLVASPKQRIINKTMQQTTTTHNRQTKQHQHQNTQNKQTKTKHKKETTHTHNTQHKYIMQKIKMRHVTIHLVSFATSCGLCLQCKKQQNQKTYNNKNTQTAKANKQSKRKQTNKQNPPFFAGCVYNAQKTIPKKQTHNKTSNNDNSTQTTKNTCRQ